MKDPFEGVDAAGRITTGVSRHRVPAVFEPVLDAVTPLTGEGDHAVTLYGSVATGQARVGTSDVDILVVGAVDGMADVEAELSARFVDLCRGVAIARMTTADLAGVGDEAYGNRLFLRHYCLHLAGPDLGGALPAFPADVRAARALNGDIAARLERWRSRLPGADPGSLGRAVARKTLLAAAGVVSVLDGTWTTDRATAVRRWGAVDPGSASAVNGLLDWTDTAPHLDRDEVGQALDGVVTDVATVFADVVGLWDRSPGPDSLR